MEWGWWFIYLYIYIFVKFIQGYNGICGGVGHPPAASSGQFLGGDRWQESCILVLFKSDVLWCCDNAVKSLLLHLGYRYPKVYQLLGFVMHTQSRSCRTRRLPGQVEIAWNQFSEMRAKWVRGMQQWHGMAWSTMFYIHENHQNELPHGYNQGLPSIARWVQARPAMTSASESGKLDDHGWSNMGGPDFMQT